MRSVVLLSLLGAGGAGLAGEFGASLGTKAAMAALKKLPGKTLTEINKKVGFRLVTKFVTKGVINLGRWVPLVGGGIGAGVNVAAMRTAGRYAKSNFRPADAPLAHPDLTGRCHVEKVRLPERRAVLHRGVPPRRRLIRGSTFGWLTAAAMETRC